MKKLLYSLASFSFFGLFFPSFLIGSSNPYGNYSAQEMPQSYFGPSTPFEAEYAPPAEQGGFAQQGHPQSWRNFGPQLRDAEPLVYREPPKQNPPRQLIGQRSNHFSINDIDDSDNDLLTLLAKINESGKFDGKVDLRSVKFKDGKKALKTISQKIPVILLKVNPNGLFKPFFFIDLSILSPDGNNTCKPGNLSDGNIRDALNNYALGSGKGWKNTHTLSNWHQLLTQGNALFFVEFNNQLFVLVPRTDENENIAGITSKNWNTSLGKKILMGAGAVAAAGAAAYGIYHLINSNNPKPGPGPQPEPVVPQTDAAPPLDAALPMKSPEPSDVHQATQDVIADSAQLSTSQTQPIQNNPEPGPKPEESAAPQTKPPSPSDVHQATQDTIADPAQLSTSQTQPNNLLANGSILQNLSGTQPISNLLANGSIPQNLSETQPIPNTPEQPQIASTQQSVSETQPINQQANGSTPQNVHQATLDAITSPVQQSIFHDPRGNTEILHVIEDEFRKLRTPLSQSVSKKAEKISVAIADYISCEKKQNPSNLFHELSTTDVEGSLRSNYMSVMQQDSITGPLLRSTWSAYEALEAWSSSEASLFSALCDYSTATCPFVGYNRAIADLKKCSHEKEAAAADAKNKVKEAKDAILSFFNSPNGSLGMNNAMTFLRTASEKAGTTFAQVPHDPTIPKPNITDNDIDIRGAQAVSCLIGLRSIEALIALSEKVFYRVTFR